MSKLFLGGIPTAPDVTRLREAFGLKEGMEITHESVEAVIGSDRKSARYRCVTNAWRRELLKQSNIEIGAIVGVGFRVLTGPERLRFNYGSFQSGTRKQGRAIRRVSLIRDGDLSQTERVNRDHIQRMGAVIVGQAAQMAKEIEPPKPMAQVSRIANGSRR